MTGVERRRTSRARHFVPLLISFAALTGSLCAGCASDEVRVSRASRAEVIAYGDDFGGFELKRRTGNLLVNMLLTDEEPETVVRRLSRYFREEKASGALAALADFCWHTGLETRDRDLAARYFLSAAAFSYGFLTGVGRPEGGYDPARIEQMWIYNQSLTQFFLYLQNRGIADNSDYMIELVNGVKVHFDAPEYDLAWPREKCGEILPCATVKIANLLMDSYRFGIGCPLVIETLGNQRRFPAGSTLPATLLLKFRVPGGEAATGGASDLHARLSYHDVFREESVALPTAGGGCETMPLALDFSAPVAYRVKKPLQFDSLFYMLRPDSTSSQEGLYMLEPYRKDKIPVVFIHGLMSSMRTWLQMINTLYADPELRRNYQFWGFTYSSGNPVLYSAHNFRNSLSALREEIASGGGDLDSFDRMVLVGHSMGGLVCKTAAMKPDGLLYRELFHHPKEELAGKLTEKQRAELDGIIDFEPLPFVRRIVFLAVPHRGSEWADSSIGALGVNLIRLPGRLISGSNELFSGVRLMLGNVGGMLDGRDLPHVRTGIENLSPSDPAMNALLKLPILVPFHTICGNFREPGVQGGSDGIVDYSSSHLDNAVSELVVKSEHSVQQQPLAIHEIRRILHRHLESVGRSGRPGDGNTAEPEKTAATAETAVDR